MKYTVPALLSALLVGCASIPQDDPLATVNYAVNKRPPCNGPAYSCHMVYPSREQLAKTARLECSGYVMAKAYTLMAMGLDKSRLKIATFQLGSGAHSVLVVDNAKVLDNLMPQVSDYAEYARFNPKLYAIPGEG